MTKVVLFKFGSVISVNNFGPLYPFVVFYLLLYFQLRLFWSYHILVVQVQSFRKLPSGKHVLEKYTTSYPTFIKQNSGIPSFLIFDPKHGLWVLS